MNARRWLFGTALLGGIALVGMSSANAQPFVEGLRKQAPDTRSDGAPEPGYLGVIAGEVRGDNAAGVAVGEVVAGGPAEKSGLKAGDLIVGIEGKEIKSMDDLGQVLTPIGAGGKATFDVMRGSEKKQIVVTLGERPGKE